MLYNAKNGRLVFENTTMDYVSFGRGKQHLVIVPGLSDGLKTVKGLALTMAYMYRQYAKEYTVHIFSRKNDMHEGYTTRDMAKDLRKAMELCGISKAHIIGLSQGGMISQFLAIDHAEVVDKLVIAVSVSRQNDIIQDAVGGWVKFAQQDNYKALFIDSLEKTYTEKKVKSYRPFYGILSKIGKPKTWDRFIIQAQACLSHNAYDELHTIKSQTFVIGGDSDFVVGLNTSEEMAERILNAQVHVYQGLGHGAFEEAKDFNHRVLQFLKS